MGGYKVWAKREKGHWRIRGRIEGLWLGKGFRECLWCQALFSSVPLFWLYTGFEVSFSGLISILLILNSGLTVGTQKKEKQEKQSFAEEEQ